MKEIQQKVDEVFKKAFGRTPLKQRLDDIYGEAIELHRYTDLVNMKEETGDLLSSILQLCNENEWDAEALISTNLAKIERRQEQYKALGRKMKVAILGGAFDPVTKGHIAVAQHVLDNSRSFDEVWLMPCFAHMNGKQMTDAGHRLAMCRLAAAVDKRIQVSPYEIKNQLSGETYYLVKRLFEEDFAKDKYDFSFIIGLDNAMTFDKWVNYEYLERHMRFVVTPRTGVQYNPDIQWFQKPPHVYVPGLKTDIDISSTKVRDHLQGLATDQDALRADLDEYLHPNVYDYILQNNLYKPQKTICKDPV